MRRLVKKIIQTLTPLFNDDALRKVIVDEAFFGIDKLTHQIDYSNPARAFTSVLVRKLMDYGDIEVDTPAIIELLDVAKHYGGFEHQIMIEELICEYWELRRDGSVDTSNGTPHKMENPHKHTIRCKNCGVNNDSLARWCTSCDYPLTSMSIEQTQRIELVFDPAVHFDYSRQLLGLNPGSDYRSIQLDFNMQRDGKIIGRGAEFSDIDVSSFDKSEGVSRSHALIAWSNAQNTRGKVGLLCITDLDSTNGTTLNGEPLQPNVPTRLADGDEVCFGELLFKVSFNARG